MFLTTEFFNFGRKNPENLSFKNCHFSTISSHFLKLHKYLSQNCDSDGHFEVLSVSKS